MHEISLEEYLNDLDDLWTRVCTEDNGMSIDARTSVLTKIVNVKELINEIRYEQLGEEDENE